MSMRVMKVNGYEFVQNMRTYAVWVYKDNTVVATAFLNGPMDRKTILELIENIKGGKRK